MNKITKSVIIAALSVSVVGVAAAQTGGMHRGGLYKHFDEVDANADGFITQDEMSAHHAERFAMKDTNGDGALSKDEMRAAMMGKMEQRLDHMFENKDKNSDGMLDASEMNGRKAQMFNKIDEDDDGKISRDEAKKMHGNRKHDG